MKMKKHLLSLVNELRTKGINIQETPPLFKWSYEEEPNIEFQLLITTTTQGNLELDTPLH